MRVYNSSNELIEDTQRHHHPMHENGGVDEIDLTGLDIDYVHIAAEVAQAFKAEYNITTDDLATYVHGIKVELTRAADIQPSNGCWFGGQFVLNAGSSGYTALDKPAYVLQAIFKGSDTSPNGTDIHVGRFETQSAGKVSDIVHILANTGTTVTGSLEYIATHIAPSVSMVNINAQSSITVPTGIKIMSGAGSSYNYGIDLASATINTADIRFQGGATLIDDGSDLTLAGSNLAVSGEIGVGISPNARYGVSISKVLTDTDNTAKMGLRVKSQVAKTSATMTGIGWGVWGQVVLDSTNTQNWTDADAGLIAVEGYVTTETGATGTISNVANLFTRTLVMGGESNASITNLHGVHIGAPSVGSSKVTNEYGLYVSDQNTGSTLNYAIYTNAGLVRFGGATTIVGELTLGATALTATATELNLLDLAGLTAGEVLVATAATTAAWQSTGVVLSAPDISGSVSAASALTLPAHSVGGTLAMGANNITLDASQTVDGIDVSAHDANTTTAHGAVSAATASKIVVRDAEGQAKFAAPAASGDALIKGTRITADELPAVTDEYYLVGTGNNMEERAVPAATTKEFFSQIFHPGTGGAWSSHGVFLDTANDIADGMFYAPSDFSSITNAEIIVRPAATQATADWDLLIGIQAVGEAVSTHSASDTTTTYDVTADEVFAIDISGLLTALAANDTVFVRLTLKNSAHDLYIMGFRFKYS